MRVATGVASRNLRLRRQRLLAHALKRLLPFLDKLSDRCLQHSPVWTKPFEDSVSTWGFTSQHKRTANREKKRE